VSSRIFAFTLGTLSAIGGFIDIGDMVADALVGARYGLRLAWVTVVAVVGIMCYAEMSGRVAARASRPALSLARSRMGPRFGLLTLVGGLAVTSLLVMAELSGIALALQLATSVHYLALVPVAAALVLAVVKLLPFEMMERLYGILGLAMLVYVVAVWRLGPDWSELWHSATTIAPTSGESWTSYLFFAVVIIGAQMTPYEMFFFSSGAIEHGWTAKDLTEIRVNVFIGFPLGGLLAIAIQAVAYLVFFPKGIEVEHLSQTALPVAVALGKVGLAIAIIGIFAATFGATLETLFATAYDLAQFFGWSYGEVQSPSRTPRFTVALVLVLLSAVGLALTTLNPITVTIYAVTFSAMLLPFAFLPVLLVANDHDIMGELVNGRLSNAVGVAVLAISVVISAAVVPLLVLSRAGGS
jgi:manganese transport protein